MAMLTPKSAPALDPITVNPSLRDWLGSAEHAGLKGKKLLVALRIVDDELIDSVQELRELRTKGRLVEVFTQQGLRLAIENAIDKMEKKPEMKMDTNVETNMEKHDSGGGENGWGEDGSASDLPADTDTKESKSKRRLSQVGMQMLKDAQKTRENGLESPCRTKGLSERKRSDLDEELVTHRSRSTSGAVIKKSRARKNERRSSTDRRCELSLPRCASTDSIDATDLVELNENAMDLHLGGLGAAGTDGVPLPTSRVRASSRDIGRRGSSTLDLLAETAFDVGASKVSTQDLEVPLDRKSSFERMAADWSDRSHPVQLPPRHPPSKLEQPQAPSPLPLKLVHERTDGVGERKSSLERILNGVGERKSSLERIFGEGESFGSSPPHKSSFEGWMSELSPPEDSPPAPTSDSQQMSQQQLYQQQQRQYYHHQLHQHPQLPKHEEATVVDAEAEREAKQQREIRQMRRQMREMERQMQQQAQQVQQVQQVQQAQQVFTLASGGQSATQQRELSQEQAQPAVAGGEGAESTEGVEATEGTWMKRLLDGYFTKEHIY
jgi:hypothetical protein